jgi:hypothetical protein
MHKIIAMTQVLSNIANSITRLKSCANWAFKAGSIAQHKFSYKIKKKL